MLTVGFEPRILRFVTRCLTDWASRDWWNLFFNSDLYTYMYFRYQCIHWYKFDDDERKRILFYACTIFCYIVKLIFNWSIAKKTQKPYKTRPNTLPDKEALYVSLVVRYLHFFWAKSTSTEKFRYSFFCCNYMYMQY